MADTSHTADTRTDTLAARLARVASACRHCPVHELPARASLALHTHGLAVVHTDQQLISPEGWRRPVVRVTITVRDTAALEPPTTFTGISDLGTGEISMGQAILLALQSLWVAALGVDVYNPLSAYDLDAGAWERHLRLAEHPHHVRGSWRKHRAAFEGAGVLCARKGACVDAVARIRTTSAETFTLAQLYAFLDAPEVVPITEPGGAYEPPPAPPRSRSARAAP